MTYPTTDNCCTRMGWVEYVASYAGGELHISVAPDADLDGIVWAYCHDEGEMVRLSGWLFTFEECYQIAAEVAAEHSTNAFTGESA